jgi:phytoene synthase
MDVELAYRHCQDVTRTRAANFFYGIRLLPSAKRRAMCSVYAFARRVDDVADGDLPTQRKLALLEVERARLEDLSRHRDDPVLAALADASGRYRLPADALGLLVDGVEMDVRGATYERFPDLVVYCRSVAGSVGRMCAAIFGASDPDHGALFADDLGVAMQLTNILRDVREDHDLGRMYLPAEDLRRFGCTDDLAAWPGAALAELIRFEAARDRVWFERGLRLLPLLDQRSASCVLAMTGIYRRILERIAEHPGDVVRRRVSLSPWEKAWVAARSLAAVAV